MLKSTQKLSTDVYNTNVNNMNDQFYCCVDVLVSTTVSHSSIVASCSYNCFFVQSSYTNLHTDISGVDTVPISVDIVAMDCARCTLCTKNFIKYI